MTFGFANMLMDPRTHPELEEVLKYLSFKEIFLETDSPYLQSLTLLWGVARRVSVIRNVSLCELLSDCNRNTRIVYDLPIC